MSELLGALFKMFLTALGLAGLGGMAYMAFGSSKSSDAIANQTVLVTNVQGAYSGQGNFSSLNNARAMLLAPPQMTSTGALLNAWNGAMTVAVDPGNAGQFVTTNPNVPKDNCQKFTTAQTNAVAVTVNGASLTVPVDAGLALSACNAATNTVVHTYPR